MTNYQWIAVTERLPNHDGEYLVTLRHRDCTTAVTTAEYIAALKRWNIRKGVTILAWGFMPDPYERRAWEKYFDGSYKDDNR